MQQKKSFFWASYADLMTSLFFVMLILFAITVSVLNHQKMVYRVKAQQLDRIQEIEEATRNLDRNLFAYNARYKKHILTIAVRFPTGQSDISTIPPNTRHRLLEAGHSIRRTILATRKKYPGVQYLVIVEGQASRDKSPTNWELSYLRALKLVAYWAKNGIVLSEFCEPLICGSGTKGTPRYTNPSEEWKNQRFLIHVVPKPGSLEE